MDDQRVTPKSCAHGFRQGIGRRARFARRREFLSRRRPGADEERRQEHGRGAGETSSASIDSHPVQGETGRLPGLGKLRRERPSCAERNRPPLQYAKEPTNADFLFGSLQRVPSARPENTWVSVMPSDASVPAASG